MKRVILRVVAMLLTFALGVAVDWLILRRAVKETPPPCKVEVVSPEAVVQQIASMAPVAPVAPLPAATPDPNFILDYDPDTFNPYGIYYIMGPKPKEFASFQSLELGLFGHSNEQGRISIDTQGDYYSDSVSAVFGLITKDRLFFVTSETPELGVEYRFEGEFIRTDFHVVAGKNTAVLRGVLTRSKNGRTLVKRTVSFRYERLGC